MTALTADESRDWEQWLKRKLTIDQAFPGIPEGGGDYHVTVDQRADGLLCEAITAQGYKCGSWRRYGMLCGTHYSIAERDLSRLKLAV